MSSTTEQPMQGVVLVHSNENDDRLIGFHQDEYGRRRDAQAASTIGSWGRLPLTGVGLAGL
jgi:hypothetical protein